MNQNNYQKSALITGANSGIGIELTKSFLELGYMVFAHYNTKKDKLVTIKNKNLILIQANLIYLNEIDKIIDTMLKYTDSIDVLINNAGLYKPVENFEQITIDIFEETLNVNLKAPFLLSQEYLKLMKNKNYGKIINISSIGVKYGGNPNTLPYTISKSALETMTITLAKEASKYNILVNAIRVGVTDTELHKSNINKDINERIKLIPLKRMASPIEIAEYILFLSSDKNKFITGSIQTIAGGE